MESLKDQSPNPLASELGAFVIKGHPISDRVAETLSTMSEERYLDTLAAAYQVVVDALTEDVENVESIEQRKIWLEILVTNRALLKRMKQKDGRIHHMVGEVLDVPSNSSSGTASNGGRTMTAELGKVLANPWHT